MKTVSTRFGLLSCLAVASLTLVGCVDAREAYDDFGSRLVDGGSGDVDGEVVSSLPDIDGDDWFIVVHPVTVDDRVIQFRATFDLTAVTENTGKVDVSAQPLTVADQTAVGDAFVASDQPVESDASFTAPFEGILPAAANSISGADAPVDSQLHAEIRSDQFICGTLTGQAGALPLEGTTWAAVRVTGDTLPAPTIWSCAQQP